MTKEQLIKYGERMGQKYFKYDSSLGFVAYNDGFTAAVELMWPLMCESIGVIFAHEFAIREDAGNTNLECYDKALKSLEQKVSGE